MIVLGAALALIGAVLIVFGIASSVALRDVRGWMMDAFLAGIVLGCALLASGMFVLHHRV